MNKEKLKSYNEVTEEVTGYELTVIDQLIRDYESYIENWEAVCDCGEEGCEDCMVTKPELVDIGRLSPDVISKTMDKYTKNYRWDWNEYDPKGYEPFYDYLGMDIDAFIEDIKTQITNEFGAELISIETKEVNKALLLEKIQNQCCYLNNLIPDDQFIEMVYLEKKQDYYEAYDPDDNEEVLLDYINVTEGMFHKYGVEFESISQGS